MLDIVGRGKQIRYEVAAKIIGVLSMPKFTSGYASAYPTEAYPIHIHGGAAYGLDEFVARRVK